MSYFSLLPKIDINVNDEYFQYVSDITVRAKFNNIVQKLYSTFEAYELQEGDTPEVVSHKLYNDVDHYWVILMLNEVIDPRFDWCLSQENLLRYVKSKYGEENVYAIHHYEKIINGVTITYNQNVAGSESISNFEYEERLNEKKRQILVPKAQYLAPIIAQFKAVVNVD